MDPGHSHPDTQGHLLIFLGVRGSIGLKNASCFCVSHVFVNIILRILDSYDTKNTHKNRPLGTFCLIISQPGCLFEGWPGCKTVKQNAPGGLSFGDFSTISM